MLQLTSETRIYVAAKSVDFRKAINRLTALIVEQSIATPGLLAAIIDHKFNRHTPLYRQEAMFAEAGISVTRGTLSNWVIKSADLLKPLVKLKSLL